MSPFRIVISVSIGVTLATTLPAPYVDAAALCLAVLAMTYAHDHQNHATDPDTPTRRTTP